MQSNTKTKIISLQSPHTGTTSHIELIEVQGGIFEMGSEKGHEDEKPVHTVNVPTFWIGKYPVTQSLYECVMGENSSHFRGADHPVEQVSWNDCQQFLQKLNMLLKREGEAKFRLPTEAEWEYAARGGRGWGKGYTYSGSNEIAEVAWHSQNSHRETKPVGWKAPNQLGIHDMSGNVWEWCEDDWHDNYENAPDDGSAWIDAPRGSSRVLRGGSWRYGPYFCRVSYRFISHPSDRYFIIGFRLILPQF